MTPLTSRLDEIESRLKAATPGKWTYFHDDELEPSYVIGYEVGEMIFHCGQGESPTKEDGELIANAPSDIAALLKAVRILLAACEVTIEADSTQHIDERYYSASLEAAAGKARAAIAEAGAVLGE